MNGQRIDDVAASLSSEPQGGMEIRVEPHTKAKTFKYSWVQARVRLDIYYSDREDCREGEAAKADVRWLTDNPGKWECMMRFESQPIRQFDFIVTDKGMITSALQQAPDAPPTLPGVSAIEVRVPKNAKFDNRIRPAAIKASRGFGLPWPNSPATTSGDRSKPKAILGPLPTASGLPDPK